MSNVWINPPDHTWWFKPNINGATTLTIIMCESLTFHERLMGTAFMKFVRLSWRVSFSQWETLWPWTSDLLLLLSRSCFPWSFFFKTDNLLLPTFDGLGTPSKEKVILCLRLLVHGATCLVCRCFILLHGYCLAAKNLCTPKASSRCYRRGVGDHAVGLRSWAIRINSYKTLLGCIQPCVSWRPVNY